MADNAGSHGAFSHGMHYKRRCAPPAMRRAGANIPAKWAGLWEAELSGAKVKRFADVPAASVAVALLLLCLVCFVGIFGYFVLQGVQQTRERLEERSRAAAQVVATNAGWMVQVAQQTLRRVDAALGPAMTGDQTSLQPALEGLPDSVDVYIIDAEANTIYATVPGASAVNVSDREYFTALREGAPFYTSGLLVSRLTGENIFVFSKRVERDGAFAGAIMVSFPDRLMQTFWASLDVDDGSTVSLVRRDGEMMARYPQLDSPMSLADHPLITRYLPQSEVGTYVSEASPVDGVARVVSYRRVPGTEIIAIASIASTLSWNAFWGAVTAVLVIVSPIVIGLVAGGVWVARLLDRDARRHKELEAALETNVLLFREIHHRVKNNLQSVQSLVRMQDMPQSAKIDLQSRLSAMAAMHEHIYRHDRYEDIDAHELVPVVVDEVVHAYGSAVAIDYDIDHVAVDRDHATPLSLLLSELVTNALKYAFAEGSGRLSVSVKDLGQGRCRLVVADDGPGLEPQAEAGTNMGMRLIRGVVAQMGGTYRFHNESGARFEAELALTAQGHEVPA